MMDDHTSPADRWAAAYMVTEMPVLEPRCQAGKETERVPYSNHGERGEAEGDGGFTTLQQGSRIPQSVLAGQIEPISATRIFSLGPPPHHSPPHLSWSAWVLWPECERVDVDTNTHTHKQNSYLLSLKLLYIIPFWPWHKPGETVHNRFYSNLNPQKQEAIFGSNKRKSTFWTNNFQSVSSGWFHLWHLYKGQIYEMAPCALSEGGASSNSSYLHTLTFH